MENTTCIYALSILQRANALLIRDGYHDLLRLTNAVLCIQGAFLLPCLNHHNPRPKKQSNTIRNQHSYNHQTFFLAFEDPAFAVLVLVALLPLGVAFAVVVVAGAFPFPLGGFDAAPAGSSSDISILTF